MSDIDLSSWEDFWDSFHLPIYMSLIGAVIGHYRKNGVIHMPIIVITFEPGPVLRGCKWYVLPLRWLYVLFDFLIFMCGLRLHRSQEKLGVWADLGFIGDLLVGVGTGIIAKCGLAIMESPSDFAVISTSLLAGFAGLSYLQRKKDEDFGEQVVETTKKSQGYTIQVEDNETLSQAASGQEDTSVPITTSYRNDS